MGIKNENGLIFIKNTLINWYKRKKGVFVETVIS